MAQQLNALSDVLIQFIQHQKIFFVATANADGHINLSPKGTDSLRVMDKNRLLWLNLTGSGNETAAHIQDNPRMTLMFNAFEGNPLILRLYGKAKVIHPYDEDWQALYAVFNPIAGARQIFELSIELVQTSCGMAVPFFQYQGEREQLTHWAEKKGTQGIQQYWADKNQISLDGKETQILKK